MELDLLRGSHFRLPHPDNQINFQRAVASTREFAYLLRRNVLDQLVFQREEQLKAQGIKVRISEVLIVDMPFVYRHYLAGNLFVQYGYAADGPEEGFFIRKTDPSKGQRVEVGINRQDKIGILWAVNGAPRIAEEMKLSASPTELWCRVSSTTCGHDTYKYTASPQSEYPAIVNYAQKIRCVTQQVAEVLSTA